MGTINNKFFTARDPHSNFFFFPLPDSWWSRHYEYLWAYQWAYGTVLDAACGISHPFKFALASSPDLQVHACDLHGMTHEEILYEVAVDTKTSIDPQLLHRIQLATCSIDNLPYESEKFDTIFCLSVLEHLSEEVQLKSLEEFYRTLKPQGKLILTCDYPDVKPAVLIQKAEQVGFSIGAHDYDIPHDAIHEPHMNLRCFSMILAKI
jgi:SAM-dependent methyltransferase